MTLSEALADPKSKEVMLEALIKFKRFWHNASGRGPERVNGLAFITLVEKLVTGEMPK